MSKPSNSCTSKSTAGSSTSPLRLVHGIVHGRVQGVGFRAFTQRAALALDLRGWVRNLWDGGVEFEAVGPSDRIDELLKRLQEGPRLAEVESLEIIADHPANGPLPDGFNIRYTY